jgi:hypothetical protein
MATKSQRLAQLLFTNRRYEEGFWPWLSKGRPTSQKNGNKFLLPTFRRTSSKLLNF